MLAFRNCICEILNTGGEKVLNDYKLFNAFVCDLATDYQGEQSFINDSFNDEILTFFKEIKRDEGSAKRVVSKVSNYLISKKKIDKTYAKYISEEIAYGILNYKLARQSKTEHAGNTPKKDKTQKTETYKKPDESLKTEKKSKIAEESQKEESVTETATISESEEDNDEKETKKETKKKHPLLWIMLFILMMLPIIGMCSNYSTVYDEYDTLEEIWYSEYKSDIEAVMDEELPEFSNAIKINDNLITTEFTPGDWTYTSDNSNVTEEDYVECIKSMVDNLEYATGKEITIEVKFYDKNGDYKYTRTYNA